MSRVEKSQIADNTDRNDSNKENVIKNVPADKASEIIDHQKPDNID